AFTHPPASSSVTIDGTKVQEVDYPRIEIDAGKHAVDVIADKKSTHEDIDANDGDAKIVTIEVAPPAAPAKKYTTVDRGADQRRSAYILGSVGAGLLIGDGAFLLYARSQYLDTDMLETRDHYRALARYAGTTVAVVSCATIGYAVYSYLRAPG